MKKGLMVVALSMCVLGSTSAMARGGGGGGGGFGGGMGGGEGHAGMSHPDYDTTRATPAEGRDSTATPAMPGNPKAEANVTSHRHSHHRRDRSDRNTAHDGD